MTAVRARGVLVAALAMLLVAVAVAVRGGARGATLPSTERARQHFLAALEAQARFDDEDMWRNLRAAWAWDAGYLPAFRDPLQGVLPQRRYAELDSIAAAQPDAALGACLRVMVANRREGVTLTLKPLARASAAARACAADIESGDYRRTAMEGDRLALRRELARRFPDSPYYVGQFFAVLGEKKEWETIVERAEEFTAPSRPPSIRAEVYGYGAWAWHHLRRHDEAVAWERRADQETRRTAGVRLRFLAITIDLHGSVLREAEGDSGIVQHGLATIAAAERERDSLLLGADMWTALDLRLRRAEHRLDQGDLVGSVREWTKLAGIVDSLQEPQLQAQVRVRRGRALVKLGRTVDAEAELLAGRDASLRAQSLHWQFEAEHNLLHLYEATGAAEAARRAGEAFVALTRAANNPAVYQMANHDLGWFHLRRGERERALPYFETVVLYSDSFPSFEYWAGEFFELTGDLERAERYFLRGRGVGDSRAYAGLARLAEATGDLDRAIRYGRAHDQAGATANYPESAPILPGMLARHGRLAEAEIEVTAARDRASRHGQVAAWATLSVELAELELRRGHGTRAAAIADSAQAEARRVAAVEASWRARGVAGLARSRKHGPESDRGLRDLNALVREVNRTGQAQLLAQILGWYGEALSSKKRTTQALAVFRRAATLTDSIAASLSLDPSRAGYRSAQMHISNSAFETILQHSRKRQAAGWFADWSVRRKSRGVVEQGAPRAAPTLEALRRRLKPDEAVIDYVVLDSTVAALVLTGDGPVLKHLPVTSDTLRKRVELLLAQLVPRLGTQVDTAHAIFDARLAWQLYQDLVAPIAQELGGRTRLTIVPDGPLHLLPFPALVVERAPLQFMLDRYTIALAPSLGFLGGAVQGPLGRLVAVRGSGSVDGSDRELTTVTGAWRVQGAVILRDSAATEAAIRLQAPGAEVLHFAGHARPNDAEPAFAFLQLAPGGVDDGLLHAYEIEELSLPGTLVVLSACETNAGRLLGGEGVLSLSRAFLRAGASGTVATLWPVGPATADVMAAFYRELARGRPTAVALREATLAQRRGRWSNPFHWAGFTLISRD